MSLTDVRWSATCYDHSQVRTCTQIHAHPSAYRCVRGVQGPREDTVILQKGHGMSERIRRGWRGLSAVPLTGSTGDMA